MVVMEEMDNVDKLYPSGLKTLDPMLLGPEDNLENKDDLEEIVHKFTQDCFPNGPKFKCETFDVSAPVMLPPKQVDDLNNVLSVANG
jgi:hypothetical protein